MKEKKEEVGVAGKMWHRFFKKKEKKNEKQVGKI